MPEYIVDCEHLPYGDGKTLVMPVSIGGHVHEQLICCRDCRFCHPVMWPSHDTRHECQLRKYSRHYTEPDKFCSEARPRDGDQQ